MIRASHARRKVRAATVNVVARRVGIAAVGGSARICGTGVRQHIFQMIRASHARCKVGTAAVVPRDWSRVLRVFEREGLTEWVAFLHRFSSGDR